MIRQLRLLAVSFAIATLGLALADLAPQIAALIVDGPQDPPAPADLPDPPAPAPLLPIVCGVCRHSRLAHGTTGDGACQFIGQDEQGCSCSRFTL